MPETQIKPSQFKAIDLPSVLQDVNAALDYVTESSMDFAKVPDAVWTQDKIIALIQILKDAQKTITDMEIKYAEYTRQWTDPETNEIKEVLLRELDPVGFDNVIQKKETALQQFAQYLEAHVALLRANPALTH